MPRHGRGGGDGPSWQTSLPGVKYYCISSYLRMEHAADNTASMRQHNTRNFRACCAPRDVRSANARRERRCPARLSAALGTSTQRGTAWAFTDAHACTAVPVQTRAGHIGAAQPSPSCTPHGEWGILACSTNVTQSGGSCGLFKWSRDRVTCALHYELMALASQMAIEGNLRTPTAQTHHFAL